MIEYVERSDLMFLDQMEVLSIGNDYVWHGAFVRFPVNVFAESFHGIQTKEEIIRTVVILYHLEGNVFLYPTVFEFDHCSGIAKFKTT